jgi:hypothetical protein
MLNCAEAQNNWRSVFESLIELLSSTVTPDALKRRQFQQKLEDLLNSSPSRIPADITFNLSAESFSPFLDIGFQFRRTKAFINEPSPFQLTFAGGPSETPFRVSQIKLQFTDPEVNHLFIDDKQQSNAFIADVDGFGQCAWIDGRTETNIKLQEQKWYTKNIDLSLVMGTRKIIEGKINVGHPHELKIESCTVVFRAAEGWQGSLIYKFDGKAMKGACLNWWFVHRLDHSTNTGTTGYRIIFLHTVLNAYTKS